MEHGQEDLHNASPIDQTEQEEVKLSDNNSGQLQASVQNASSMWKHLRIEKRANPGVLLLLMLCCLALPAVAAPEESVVVLGVHSAVNLPAPHQPSRMSIGTLCILGTYAISAFTGFVGLLMGVSSVVWVMLRNAPEVPPKIAWTVFVMWLFLFLAYIAEESRRVALPKLYVFFTLVVGWLCMCFTAAVQKSSIDVIAPPIASFAAYVVAFAFPDRPRRATVLPI